jgi:signal transduction histidine kinase
MIEIYRAEENLFQSDAFMVREALRESLLETLEALAPQVLENLCIDNQNEVEALFKSERIFVQIRGKYCDSPFCHDRRKLQQILRNLVNNALKYRREQLKVDISGDEDLFVSVEDDGCGIAPDQQENIFKRFSGLKAGKKGEAKGMGFGLCGVKVMVETMGGEIRVESAEGCGARFTVRIPPLQGRHGSLLDGKAIDIKNGLKGHRRR